MRRSKNRTHLLDSAVTERLGSKSLADVLDLLNLARGNLSDALLETLQNGNKERKKKVSREQRDPRKLISYRVVLASSGAVIANTDALRGKKFK
jgi:hypothetical protein